MGVRYPSFTNGISLVYYKANMDDIHEMMNHYALFNDTSRSQKMVKHQTDEKMQLPVQQKSSTEDNEGTFIDKIKNFLAHFFD